MSQKISKILVAIDGSEPSIRAAHQALEMAKQNNSEITTLYISFIPLSLRFKSRDILDAAYCHNQLPVLGYTSQSQEAQFFQRGLAQVSGSGQSFQSGCENSGCTRKGRKSLKTFLILRKAMNKRVVPINAKIQTRAVYGLHLDTFEHKNIKHSIIIGI